MYAAHCDGCHTPVRAIGKPDDLRRMRYVTHGCPLDGQPVPPDQYIVKIW